MATLMVGYDLKKPGQDYEELIQKLNSFPTHWHCLDSTWFVVESMTPTQLRDALSPLIDGNDALIVLDVSGDAGAWTGFSDQCSAWLVNNV